MVVHLLRAAPAADLPAPPRADVTIDTPENPPSERADGALVDRVDVPAGVTGERGSGWGGGQVSAGSAVAVAELSVVSGSVAAVSDEVSGVDPARAGFVVSKAVGGAVVRNRVKRRLRHLMAERIDRLPPGATVVVRAQPSAAARRYQEIALDLENALDAALRPGRRQ